MTSITIPDGVTSISQGAFGGCTGLSFVSISEGVTGIGKRAFFNCTSLTSITIPASVTSIDDSFEECYALTSVSFAEGSQLTSIGKYSFYFCTNLASIAIPEGVTSIGRNAFTNCSGLTSVTIPSSVTNIEDGTFYGCTGLTDVYCDADPSALTWSMDNEDKDFMPDKATKFHVADTSVWEEKFPDANVTFVDEKGAETQVDNEFIVDNLKYRVLDPTETKASMRKVEGLYTVEVVGCVTSPVGAVDIPATVNYKGVDYDVTRLSEKAFRNCIDLTAISIPSSVTHISSETFMGCSGLTSIVVDEGNTRYDSRDNCNAIIETATNTLMVGCQTTVIPNSVTEIDEVAFSGCSNLATLTIPDGVTKIGIRAFRDCSSLQSVDIPDGVTEIQMWAFEGCSGLTDVYCHAANVPSTDSDAFEGVKVADATLHVPAASIDAYKAAEPWSGFGKIVALPSVEPDAIQGVTSADASDNVWYTLDGMKLQGEPTVPGVYVKDGKKVVVK